MCLREYAIRCGIASSLPRSIGQVGSGVKLAALNRGFGGHMRYFGVLELLIIAAACLLCLVPVVMGGIVVVIVALTQKKSGPY